MQIATIAGDTGNMSTEMFSDFEKLYASGLTVAEVAAETGMKPWTVRRRLLGMGKLRNQNEAQAIARGKNRFAGKRTRAGIPMPETAKATLREKAIARHAATAVGTTIKPSGYVEYTRGPNEGRSVHVCMIEERIGRRILEDEVVYHIDGDRQNNNINNLALMTRSAHTRLHRREDALAGKQRARNTSGQFS